MKYLDKRLVAMCVLEAACVFLMMGLSWLPGWAPFTIPSMIFCSLCLFQVTGLTIKDAGSERGAQQDGAASRDRISAKCKSHGAKP